MNSLTIENGHKAHITGFYQYPTYRHLLAGHRNRKINRHILKEVEAVAKDYAKQENYMYPVYVIEPLEKPLHYVVRHNPFNYQFATLPNVTCIVLLQCLESFEEPEDEDDIMEYPSSTLAVVWFQDSYAFPIDAFVLEQIKQIPWLEVSSDELQIEL
ncbi:hypothetical protein BKI52_40325 [marine bacterium AO1-C]|nr:hypothetical protein BKI52_40325 [marine bacterium AO1-C]